MERFREKAESLKAEGYEESEHTIPIVSANILAVLIMLSLAGTVLCAGMLLVTGISLALKKITAAQSWKWMILDLLIAAVPLIVCGFRFTQLWNSVRGLVSILIA